MKNTRAPRFFVVICKTMPFDWMDVFANLFLVFFFVFFFRVGVVAGVAKGLPKISSFTPF